MCRTIVILLFLCCTYSTNSSGQKPFTTTNNSTAEPLPAFSILLLDGKTLVETASISNNQPTIFILFSPDCEHCNEVAKLITEHVNLFDSVNLCMLSTPAPLNQLLDFADKNNLLSLEQITVGMDVDFFLGRFFKTKSVPFVAVYDRNKRLICTIDKLKNINQLVLSLKSQ